jgi:hypothetical protein
MSIKTKSCLDPWSFLLVKADGSVCLCCWSEPIGNINESSLDDIISGEKAQALRSSLLEGNLAAFCVSCIARDDTTIDKLQADVSTYLTDESRRYVVSQGELIDLGVNGAGTGADQRNRLKKRGPFRVLAKLKRLKNLWAKGA